jgi:hypothetical protein
MHQQQADACHLSFHFLPIQKFCWQDGICSLFAPPPTPRVSDHVQKLYEHTLRRKEFLDHNFHPANARLNEISPTASPGSTLL